MKRYRVISPFRLKDNDGKPKGYAESGHIVHLDNDEARRLVNAHCIEEVETMMQSPQENRKRGRPRKCLPS